MTPTPTPTPTRFITNGFDNSENYVDVPTPTPTSTILPALEVQARDEVVVFYNQNSNESLQVANYYTNNRPYFSNVRKVALDIPEAVYPAMVVGSEIYCTSGCDIDVPYEGCRKYDFISQTLATSRIVQPILNYLQLYPATKYIIFTLDVPCIIVNDSTWGVTQLTASPSMPSNLTNTIRLTSGRIPFYITGALSADCIAYIDKLKTANSEGLILYKDRNFMYTEDSTGAGFDGLEYFRYPQTVASISAYSVYRSGKNRISTGPSTGLTGIFMDQSPLWPHNTGNISITSIALWGSWGFNGRRFIFPNGPYIYSIAGEEVPGLSSMAYYVDPNCSGKLTFSGPGDGWYFAFTMESFNGIPGAYARFYSFPLNWGRFPTSYTGEKNFKSYKNSPQFAQGLRPIQHSTYTMYFRKSAFGGTNYENTPLIWVGATSEPGYPSVITSTWMSDWYQGNTAYSTVTANPANRTRLLAIGDPLTRVRTAFIPPSPTPTQTQTSSPTPSVTPTLTPTLTRTPTPTPTVPDIAVIQNNQNVFISNEQLITDLLVTNNVTSFNIFLNQNEYFSLLTSKTPLYISAYNLNNVQVLNSFLPVSASTLIKTESNFYYYTLTFVSTGSFLISLQAFPTFPAPDYYIESLRLSASSQITNTYYTVLSVLPEPTRSPTPTPSITPTITPTRMTPTPTPTATSFSPVAASINWDFSSIGAPGPFGLESITITGYNPFPSNENDRPRINVFRTDGLNIFMSAGRYVLYPEIPPNAIYQPWGNRSVSSYNVNMPLSTGQFAGVDIFWPNSAIAVIQNLHPPLSNWTQSVSISSLAQGIEELKYQYIFYPGETIFVNITGRYNVVTPNPTPSNTPTNTPTPSITPTRTPTPSITSTSQPTRTPTSSNTPTRTPTITPTPSNTSIASNLNITNAFFIKNSSSINLDSPLSTGANSSFFIPISTAYSFKGDIVRGPILFDSISMTSPSNGPCLIFALSGKKLFFGGSILYSAIRPVQDAMPTTMLMYVSAVSGNNNDLILDPEFDQISYNGSMIAALSSGKLFVNGSTTYGPLGVGKNTTSNYFTPVLSAFTGGTATAPTGLINNPSFTKISVVGEVLLALSGTDLYGSGRNFRGELGLGNTSVYRYLRRIDTNVQNIYGNINDYHASSSTSFIKKNNLWYMAGYNYGGIGGTSSQYSTFTLVPFVSADDSLSLIANPNFDIIVPAGSNNFFALSAGKLYSTIYGDSTDYSTGLSGTPPLFIPTTQHRPSYFTPVLSAFLDYDRRNLVLNPRFDKIYSDGRTSVALSSNKAFITSDPTWDSFGDTLNFYGLTSRVINSVAYFTQISGNWTDIKIRADSSTVAILGLSAI